MIGMVIEVKDDNFVRSPLGLRNCIGCEIDNLNATYKIFNTGLRLCYQSVSIRSGVNFTADTITEAQGAPNKM